MFNPAPDDLVACCIDPACRKELRARSDRGLRSALARHASCRHCTRVPYRGYDTARRKVTSAQSTATLRQIRVLVGPKQPRSGGRGYFNAAASAHRLAELYALRAARCL